MGCASSVPAESDSAPTIVTILDDPTSTVAKLIQALSTSAPDEVVLPLITPETARAKISAASSRVEGHGKWAGKLSGYVPLHIAAKHSANVTVVQALLDAFPESVAVRESKGRTPLHMALEHHADLALVKLLIATDPATTTVRTNMPEYLLPIQCARTPLRAPRCCTRDARSLNACSRVARASRRVAAPRASSAPSRRRSPTSSPPTPPA